MKLVLTLVERAPASWSGRALHRVDRGDLTEEEEERLGSTLLLLHDRMTGLCAQYGLTMDDLNLDLGPLRNTAAARRLRTAARLTRRLRVGGQAEPARELSQARCPAALRSPYCPCRSGIYRCAER
nr:gas vesicle protein K [Streptomyces sp. SJL17-1]